MHLRSVCVSAKRYCELWREATQSVAYKMTVWKDRATHLLLIWPLDLFSALGLHVFLYVYALVRLYLMVVFSISVFFVRYVKADPPAVGLKLHSAALSLSP